MYAQDCKLLSVSEPFIPVFHESKLPKFIFEGGLFSIVHFFSGNHALIFNCVSAMDRNTSPDLLLGEGGGGLQEVQKPRREDSGGIQAAGMGRQLSIAGDSGK